MDTDISGDPRCIIPMDWTRAGYFMAMIPGPIAILARICPPAQPWDIFIFRISPRCRVCFPNEHHRHRPPKPRCQSSTSTPNLHTHTLASRNTARRTVQLIRAPILLDTVSGLKSSRCASSVFTTSGPISFPHCCVRHLSWTLQ